MEVCSPPVINASECISQKSGSYDTGRYNSLFNKRFCGMFNTNLLLLLSRLTTSKGNKHVFFSQALMKFF